MRSQVQVLPGPPPITPGQSAVGSKPRALVASLGRAGAACPSSPVPPGTPTRGVGYHDHHSPWSPPSPDGSHAAGAATSHRSLYPCPPSSRQPPVLRTTAWPACSLSGHAPPYPTRPGSATNPPLTNATSQHRPRLGLLGRRPNRSTAWQPTGTRPVPVVTVPAAATWAQRHRPVWEETDASGPTGRTPAGWTPHGRTAAGWTLDGCPPEGRTPDRWTADDRTAGHPDDEPR
jgi:hypothetical protein